MWKTIEFNRISTRLSTSNPADNYQLLEGLRCEGINNRVILYPYPTIDLETLFQNPFKSLKRQQIEE